MVKRPVLVQQKGRDPRRCEKREAKALQNRILEQDRGEGILEGQIRGVIVAVQILFNTGFHKNISFPS